MSTHGRVPLTILADVEQRQALGELARAEDRSMGSVVRAAVDEYLTRKHQVKPIHPTGREAA